MSALDIPNAGAASHMPGWIWLVVPNQEMLVTVRARFVTAVLPQWDRDRDVCTGCLVDLLGGRTIETIAMPQEIEAAILDAKD